MERLARCDVAAETPCFDDKVVVVVAEEAPMPARDRDARDKCPEAVGFDWACGGAGW